MTETPAWTTGIHLAEVVEDNDPMSLNRVRVRLAGLGLELWAPVLIPGGGAGYGVALTPRRGETVAVAFPGGDPAHPLVLGAIWSGAGTRPPAAGHPGTSYAIVSPQGAAIRIEEVSDTAPPAIVLETDHQTRIRLDAGAGGSLLIEHPEGSITLSEAGISVTSAATVSVSASHVTVTAGIVTIDAGMTRAAGVVQCDTLITNAVVSASYTPGAGNIW